VQREKYHGICSYRQTRFRVSLSDHSLKYLIRPFGQIKQNMEQYFRKLKIECAVKSSGFRELVGKLAATEFRRLRIQIDYGIKRTG